jgi:hypothetical protein
MSTHSAGRRDRSALSRSAQLFTDLMTDSARESLALRREIGKRISAIALPLRLEGIRQTGARLLHRSLGARSMIGGIVALYLDRFGPCDLAKHLLLSAADRSPTAANRDGCAAGGGGRQEISLVRPRGAPQDAGARHRPRIPRGR